jgi:hypothetical protein
MHGRCSLTIVKGYKERVVHVSSCSIEFVEENNALLTIVIGDEVVQGRSSFRTHKRCSRSEEFALVADDSAVNVDHVQIEQVSQPSSQFGLAVAAGS